VDVVALLLADSRFPGGGHAHSGGLEEAAARGLVTDEASLAGFLRGRLRTAGELAAAFAARAAGTAGTGTAGTVGTEAAGTEVDWLALDRELDARTPSPAQRAASRAQGRGAARAGRRAWPSPVLTALLAATPQPHHPIVLGALVRVAGGAPRDAALAAGYLAVTGPASAAIRLLGLDPFGVNALLADLAAALAALADRADEWSRADPADLPAPNAPGLDLLAEAHLRHHTREVRLFAS
jgi:urease accessory protein